MVRALHSIEMGISRAKFISILLGLVSFPYPSLAFLNYTFDLTKVSFRLYADSTNYLDKQIIGFKDLASLQNLKIPWKPNAPTVICTHGFLDSADPNPITYLAFREFGGVHNVTRAYANSGFFKTGNFLVVDWGPLAGYIMYGVDLLPLYVIAMSNVPRVAQRITEFMEWLAFELKVLDLNKVHLIGHSLGAFVVGHIGRNIYRRTNGQTKIPRITGLDPAGPFYWLKPPSHRLSLTDAIFVDVVHVNANPLLFGDTSVDGHIDFFPNGGITMPGCALAFDVVFCSHLYIWKLYAASFSTSFLCCQCSRFLDPIKLKECMGACPGGPQVLGPYTPPTARGQYFCDVTALP